MRICIMTLVLVATPAAAQLGSHSSTVVLVDGTRVTCTGSSYTGRYLSSSSTRCEETRKSYPVPLPEIDLDPEAESLWNVAFGYIEQASPDYGSKRRWRRLEKRANGGPVLIPGEFGTMAISADSLHLGGYDLERKGRSLEEAIWFLVQIEGARQRIAECVSSPQGC